MKYFKNTELAKLYHVSEKSVRNWIEAAAAGKLDLQLFEKNKKNFIANTSKNTLLIEKQVEKGKKFRNTRGLKNINPRKEFYKLYNRKQIIVIVSNIAIHREIPLQYGYFDGGAQFWDSYSSRLANEQNPNILTSTVELLDIDFPYISRLLGDTKKVNVVDLGPGNGIATREVLAKLLHEGRLNRYIVLDISPDLLTILKKNIHSWFGGRIEVESYIRNFAEERFDDLFAEERYKMNDSPKNLVFLLGGTLSNLRSPDHALRVINDSLGSNDLLLCSSYLDTPSTRRYFDFTTSGDKKFSPPSMTTLGLLGIDESLCDIELIFNEAQHSRLRWMKPKIDLLVQFELAGESWNVELQKGEPILLWRHKHYSYIDIVKLFDKNGFSPIQTTKSTDQNYLLSILKIKTGIIS